MRSFEDKPAYVRIAIHLRDRQLTQAQLARSMGMGPGALTRHLGEMRDGELLSFTGDGGRGTEYWVPEAQHDALDAALSAHQPLGSVVAGQTGLRVDEISDLSAFAAVVSDPARTAGLLWWVEAGDGYLLVLAKDAGAASVGSLRSAIEQAGCRCRAFRFAEPARAEGLRALARAWRDAGDAARAELR